MKKEIDDKFTLSLFVKDLNIFVNNNKYWQFILCKKEYITVHVDSDQLVISLNLSDKLENNLSEKEIEKTYVVVYGGIGTSNSTALLLDELNINWNWV